MMSLDFSCFRSLIVSLRLAIWASFTTTRSLSPWSLRKEASFSLFVWHNSVTTFSCSCNIVVWVFSKDFEADFASLSVFSSALHLTQGFVEPAGVCRSVLFWAVVWDYSVWVTLETTTLSGIWIMIVWVAWALYFSSILGIGPTWIELVWVFCEVGFG